jgi:hypothetical protein
MKHLKKFNEDIQQDKPLQPKVKHLIEYLSKLDPEMDVHLDHDGWLYGNDDAKTEAELVENRGLFYVSTYDGKTYMIINN